MWNYFFWWELPISYKRRRWPPLRVWKSWKCIKSIYFLLLFTQAHNGWSRRGWLNINNWARHFWLGPCGWRWKRQLVTNKNIFNRWIDSKCNIGFNFKTAISIYYISSSKVLLIYFCVQFSKSVGNENWILLMLLVSYHFLKMRAWLKNLERQVPDDTLMSGSELLKRKSLLKMLQPQESVAEYSEIKTVLNMVTTIAAQIILIFSNSDKINI